MPPLAILTFGLAACAPAPEALPADAPVATVCEAGRQPVGARIKVQGEFDGTDYATQPTTITLSSDELCSERGAGLVFAEVFNRSEMSKIANARPRGKRFPRTPGATLMLEGTIAKLEDGRFVHLERALVTSVETEHSGSR